LPVINEHQKFLNDIRSYVNSFTSNITEKREFAVNFFNRNKSNHNVYQALIQITDNTNESYDLRLQTITILKKVFNKRDFESYIKMKNQDIEYQNNEYYQKSNINNYFDYTKTLGDGINNNNSKMTDEFLNLMLPSAHSNNDLSLQEEDDHLLSHFGFNFDRKNNKVFKSKNIKVSVIDSLFYIDQEISKNQKLQEMSKKLIISEMKNLPSLEDYRKMINKHFDKYMHLEKSESNNCNESSLNRENLNNKISEENFLNLSNTRIFVEDYFKNKKEKIEENSLFSFKDKIQTQFEDILPNKLNDEENWKRLISFTDSSMENFNIYNFNLDLYTKYGPIVWKKFIDNFEFLTNLLEKEKNSLKEKCDEINKERKFNQVNFASKKIFIKNMKLIIY